MFGVIVASLENVSEMEKARYQQLYCGLCHSLKSRYGQVSRFCVNYDMAFLALLLESMYESGENQQQGTCIVHPAKPHYFLSGRYVDYAADMSLILAYHKCIDNWIDENSASSLAYSKVISRGYRRLEQRYAGICKTTSEALENIRKLEIESHNIAIEAAMQEDFENQGLRFCHTLLIQRADEITKLFGIAMGEMFAYFDGHWKDSLKQLGYELGRFVYLMDAAVDRGADLEKNAYNPFNICRTSDDDIMFVLNDSIGAASRIFETLPLEKDLHLLRSVMYAGVWQKLSMMNPGIVDESVKP